MAHIEHYEFGRIVVDGQEERRDLIILPDRVVRNWWRQDGHALILEDLDEVVDDLPEHLVIGTGAHGQMRPDPPRAGAASSAWGDGGEPANRPGRPPLRRAGARSDGGRATPHVLMIIGAGRLPPPSHLWGRPPLHDCPGDLPDLARADEDCAAVRPFATRSRPETRC